MAPWLGSARGTGGAVLAAALIVISVLPSATASAAAAATLPPQLHRPPAHPHNKQLSHGASPARRARPLHDSVPAPIRLGQRAFVTTTGGPPPPSVLPGTCFLEPRAPTSDAPRRRHGRRSARAQRPLPCRSAARGGARARPRPSRAQGAHDNRTQVRDSGSAAPHRRAATSCRTVWHRQRSQERPPNPPPGSSAVGRAQALTPRPRRCAARRSRWTTGRVSWRTKGVFSRTGLRSRPLGTRPPRTGASVGHTASVRGGGRACPGGACST